MEREEVQGKAVCRRCLHQLKARSAKWICSVTHDVVSKRRAAYKTVRGCFSQKGCCRRVKVDVILASALEVCVIGAKGKICIPNI